MEAKCDACGFTGTCPDSFAGRTIQCPKCGHEFVVKGDSAFSLVEESLPKKTNRPTLVEEEIGSIGDLKVTNKRIVGEINKKEKIGNGVKVTRVNIDVILNMITGITVIKDYNFGARVAGCLFTPLAVIGAIIGISAIISEDSRAAEPGAVMLVMSFVFGLFGVICLLLSKSRVHLQISIAGVDHFIPYETSCQKEAEEKCNMLRNAKSEYERLMGV